MLSGVPYGYRYVRKTDQVAAYYEIIEAEADVGLRVYERYTVSHMSIGAITRWLNERGVPTRKRCGRWERSSVWAMLRNPAYKGSACFGKTRIAPRQRITRPLRLHGGIAARNSANHERPREEWIEIPVPAIVSDETFALAQERLERNKVHAPRRTITPSVVQGLVSCRKCGYALSRTSTRSSARTIHYYRCLGSDAWRHLGGRVCDNRPVRQDLLDQVVWAEIIKLLETPSLIQEELDRRLAAARTSDPTQRREKALQRDLARLRKSMDRLLTAYQEDLISLDELRRRMPALRQREQATPRHATPRHATPRTPSCSRSSIRLAIAPPICAWPKPWPASSPGCAHPRRPSTFTSGSGSCGSWSATTRSSFATRSRSPTIHRPAITPRPHPSAARPPAIVTFCVQGVMSPLLSNILLDDLDKELERRGHHFCRYADDVNIYVASRRAGERVMASLTHYLEAKLRLKVNRTKSAVARPWERKFLGYTVTNHRSPRLMPAPGSVKRAKDRIREITHKGRGRNILKVIEEINLFTRGWIGYFRLSTVRRPFDLLDQWLRRRLRKILWEQWRKPKTCYRKLVALGVKAERARKATATGRGAWWNAGASHMHAAITNRLLAQWGLLSLLDQIPVRSRLS